MDPSFTEESNPTNGFKFDDAFLPTFSPSENLANTFQFQDGVVALTSSGSSEVECVDDSDFSNNVLKFINCMLMEENMEQNSCMFHEPLAVRATEKSLCDVIGEKYPVCPDQNTKPPNEYLITTSSEHSINSNTSCGSSVDSQWIVDPGAFIYRFETTRESSTDNRIGLMISAMSSHLVTNMFSNNQSILQFKRGVEEASKFLPSNNRLIIDSESNIMSPLLQGQGKRLWKL